MGQHFSETNRSVDVTRRVFMTDKEAIQMRQMHREDATNIEELSRIFHCTLDVIKGHLHTAQELKAHELYKVTDGQEGAKLPYASQLLTSEDVARKEADKREEELLERIKELEGVSSSESEGSGTPSERDEFGPLRDTEDWNKLNAQAKGALTKKRAAAESAKLL